MLFSVILCTHGSLCFARLKVLKTQIVNDRAGFGHKGADMSLKVRAQVTQVEIDLEK